MKKSIRIMYLLLIALFFTNPAQIGLAVSVEENIAKSGSTANVVVETGNIGDKLAIYKVVDANLNDTTNDLTMKFTEDFKRFQKQSDQNIQDLTVENYSAFKNNSVGLKNLLGNFAAYVRKQTNSTTIEPTQTAVVGQNGSATFENLAMGQYIVVGTGNTTGALIYQTVTAETVPHVKNNEYYIKEQYNVAMKTVQPKASKTVAGVQISTTSSVKSANIGDVLTYTLTATVPTYPQGAMNTTFFMKDVLPKGITLDEKKIKVMHGTSELTQITSANGPGHYWQTYNQTDNILYIDFDYTKIKEMDQITVTYKASLNEQAAIAGEGNKNTYHLIYSNSPYEGSTYLPDLPENPNRPDVETPGYGSAEDSETVYTYALIIDKYEDGDGNESKKLSGATFEIYDNKETTTSLAKVTTDSNGFAAIVGLAEGTYYLKETKAPAGYNLLPEPQEIKILDGQSNSSINQSDSITILGKNQGDPINVNGVINQKGIKKKIANKSGFTLPSTGGMGTKLFMIVGLSMMIGALIILMIRNRRMKD